MLYIILAIMLYTLHRVLYRLTLAGIEADAVRRIEDARKLAFQSKFFRLNRHFTR